MKLDTLDDLVSSYEDRAPVHKAIVDECRARVAATPTLARHRAWVEQNIFGFGDRAFHWMWKLIVDSMPEEFRFLEIGVFRGQVLSLVAMLSREASREAGVYGISPLSTFAGVSGKFTPFWESDYAADLARIHREFDVPFSLSDQIVVADSTSDIAVAAAGALAPFDVIYIDGCHEYDYVEKDLKNYPPMLKRRGLLVVDDSSDHLDMPWGYFSGIPDVSDAVRDIVECDGGLLHLAAVMHNRIWRKL